MTAEAPRHENRLASETSPYLLQHAHNPVDWYPWGPEALERARREDKPILLSIGYAACHWCHVMERESFENEAIAKLMNEHFVCIKVDREERPDLDDVYMAATVAMSGGGGWPMTVFLTPEQQPFFAGTYFPPGDKYGRPGFPSLLNRIAELWKKDRQSLAAQAAELTEHVRSRGEPAEPLAVGERAMRVAVQQLRSSFDSRYGGFTSAPKFPPSPALALLLRWHRRTGDERALGMVKTTLDAMRQGGIYDHIGGGFARYATDERWLVPHFEKMLYDNAQLARVYLEAHQVTGDTDYRRVAAEVLDYIVREMQGPEGGYYSATDADSEGEEGKFFVWQPDEVRELLGTQAAERFCLYYDITEEGNWEGKNIVNTPRQLEEIAREVGMSVADLGADLERSRQTLYEARKKRIPPLLDDKVLVSWNGLMIGAMAEGHRVLGDGRYLESAERAARYLLTTLRRPDGGLYRTARAGVAHLDAYLEDYAYLADALVTLYEAGGSASFLNEAAGLAERMLADFSDPEGGALFHTAHQHESLIARLREGHDGALPNPNAVAASALARLSHHLSRDDWRQAAENALFSYGRYVDRQPRAFATALAVVDFLLEGPVELAFVGTPGDAGYEALLREVGKRYLPNRIVGHLDPLGADAAGAELPLVAQKSLVGGRAALYVCRDFTCRAPVTDASQVEDALEEAARGAAQLRKSEVGARALPGFATAEHTARYAASFREKLGERAYTALGSTGLTVSRVGFGGYRVDDQDPEHRAALRHAFESGVNLVDTSTNYGDGGSERLMGSVLRELVTEKKLEREEVVVVSKIGYVQAQNMELAVEREAEGSPFPEMVKYADSVWHCMHPDWLDDQLGRSLSRLGLDTLDVCLVHNPEYYFSDAVKRGQGPLDRLRDDFYRRLEAAFAHFEKEVSRGRVKAYGVSSNTSVAPADYREATSLVRMLAAAERAGGPAHHFRVLQLPMNLLEGGAVLEKNNDGKTVLDVARENRIAVLVNRPLNAIQGESLLRLAEPPAPGEAPPFDAQLSRVAQLEEEFRRNLAPRLRVAPGSASPQMFFNWADQLGSLPARLESREQWLEIENGVIGPRLMQLLPALDRAFSGDAAQAWQDWRGRYLADFDGLLAALRKRATERGRVRVIELRTALDPLLPEARRADPLSQKALWALGSAPGVTCVLVGMRQTRYVDDALAAVRHAELPGVERLFEAARSL